MPEGSLQKAAKTARKSDRKLSEKIDGKDVYVRDLTNDDLDGIEEYEDEHSELQVQRDELIKQLDDVESADERRKLRAQARELSQRIRRMNTQMLNMYIEAADGERFEQDVIDALPVRIQTLLYRTATEIISAKDPTQAGNTASG